MTTLEIRHIMDKYWTFDSVRRKWWFWKLEDATDPIPFARTMIEQLYLDEKAMQAASRSE